MTAPPTGTRSTDRATAPDPDDPRKPRSPDDLTTRSWRYLLRTTRREFLADQCTDVAAALTYYAALAVARRKHLMDFRLCPSMGPSPNQ